jgi:hypothetical protein
MNALGLFLMFMAMTVFCAPRKLGRWLAEVRHAHDQQLSELKHRPHSNTETEVSDDDATRADR